MDTSEASRKRKSTNEDVRASLQRFLIAKKRVKTENLNEPRPSGSETFNPPTSSWEMYRNSDMAMRFNPLHLDLPTAHFNHQDLNSRWNSHTQFSQYCQQDSEYCQQFLLQNMSPDDDNEPKKLFTLYDIKDDETSKGALDAKRRLRFTNIHALICPQEKMFLTTACDYFLAAYEELIEYIEAIGKLRNKQIIVEHCYYKLFMHTLKMFYYTDKGWRFNIEFDEFFSGYLRKYREPVINQMKQNWNNAKKAAKDAAKELSKKNAYQVLEDDDY